MRLLFASLAHDRGPSRRLPTQKTARSDYGAAKVKPTTGRRTGTELKKRSGTAHASHLKSSTTRMILPFELNSQNPIAASVQLTVKSPVQMKSLIQCRKAHYIRPHKPNPIQSTYIFS